jgi:ketosteroid isomerase-like protein
MKEAGMADVEAVLAANDAFYRAFESLDVAQMELVWLRAPHVTCVHPGWGALTGWGPVMASWSRIFEDTLAMRFRLTEVEVEVRGDAAWVVCVENIESDTRDGRMAGAVQATNLFERRDGRWLVVHHHGSPIYPPLAGGPTDRVH